MSKVRPIHVVLIVLVAGVVALYAGGVGLGLGGGDGRGDMKSTVDTWRARIEGWLGAPEPVRAGELRWQGGRKILPGVRRFADTATLHIEPRDDGRRALTVRTSDAMELIIRRSALPGMAMTLQTEADKDNEVDIRVRGQARVEMTCQSDQCTVRIDRRG